MYLKVGLYLIILWNRSGLYLLLKYFLELGSSFLGSLAVRNIRVYRCKANLIVTSLGMLQVNFQIYIIIISRILKILIHIGKETKIRFD